MRDVPAVFLTAARLLVRHWPALLALSFLGAALRAAALWGAVSLSDVQGQLGQALLVLTPLGYLLPVVGMLTLCGRSLPALRANDDLEVQAPVEGRRLRLVDVAISVAVPFLLVYQAYGLLEQDIQRFRNLAAFDEFNQFSLGGGVEYDFSGRLGVYPFQVAVMIVLVAYVVRLALGRLESRVKFLGLAFVGALIEVYYSAAMTAQSIPLKAYGGPWLRDRRVVEWLEDLWQGLIDALGPVATAAQWLRGGVETVLGSLNEVVVVPVSWLSLAAVVLGYNLITFRRTEPPAEVHGVVATVRQDLRERWDSLLEGVRLLAAAGLAPMLAFTLVFLVVIRIPPLLAEVARQVLGPQRYETGVALAPVLDSLAFSLSLAVTAPLLAAAIDWLVRARAARRSPGRSTTPAPA